MDTDPEEPQDPYLLETKKVKHKIDDLENSLSDLELSDKHVKINEIKKYIFDNRNELDLLELDHTLDGRVRQLMAQTSGYRAWFLSSAKKEELREKAKCLDLLRVSMLDAQVKIKEEKTKQAQTKLVEIVNSFQFSETEKRSVVINGTSKDSITSDEYHFYLGLFEELSQEKYKEIYIQMIHFVVQFKEILNDKLLLNFAKLLDQRIQKMEYILKHKQSIGHKYTHIIITPQQEETFQSSKLKSNMVILKDLRDLILTEMDKRLKAVA